MGYKRVEYADIRAVVDPIFVQLMADLNDVYYNNWAKDQPARFGKFNVANNPEESKVLFDYLMGYLSVANQLVLQQYNMDNDNYKRGSKERKKLDDDLPENQTWTDQADIELAALNMPRIKWKRARKIVIKAIEGGLGFTPNL